MWGEGRWDNGSFTLMVLAFLWEQTSMGNFCTVWYTYFWSGGGICGLPHKHTRNILCYFICYLAFHSLSIFIWE